MSTFQEKKMRSKTRVTSMFEILVATAVLSMSAPAYAATDAAGAEALARKEGCVKCHAVDKKKMGPSYREIAAKYKGKSDGEASLIKRVTTGEQSKFPDGHQEAHAIIATKDTNQIKNLVDWILAQ
jgi:cytochrome c